MKYVSEDKNVIIAKCEKCFAQTEVSKNRCKKSGKVYTIDRVETCACGAKSDAIFYELSQDVKNLSIEQEGFKERNNDVRNVIVNITVCLAILIVLVTLVKVVSTNQNENSIRSNVSIDDNEIKMNNYKDELKDKMSSIVKKYDFATFFTFDSDMDAHMTIKVNDKFDKLSNVEKYKVLSNLYHDFEKTINECIMDKLDSSYINTDIGKRILVISPKGTFIQNYDHLTLPDGKEVCEDDILTEEERKQQQDEIKQFKEQQNIINSSVNGLIVQDVWKWTIDNNYIYVRGRVKNIGNSNITYWKLTVEFCDSNKNVLDTDFTNSLETVRPGSMKSFEIMHKYDSEYKTARVFIDEAQN